MKSPSRQRRHDYYDDLSPHPAATKDARPKPTASAAAATTTSGGPAVSGAGTKPGQPTNKKKKKEGTAAVTPEASGFSSFSKRMAVEKHVVNELLLVFGVIGTAVSAPDNNDHGNDKDEDEDGYYHDADLIVPVTDCLNWLQDLQRALRRDDDQYRPISLLLSDWKVVAHKLLPVVLSCRYDAPIVLTVCKILVILTKPLTDTAVRAGRMVIDTKKASPEVVKEQIKLRENALKQADVLLEYKRIICHHPSHHKRNQKGKPDGSGGGGAGKGGGGILSIFVSLLAEPLSKTGTARTDHDHLAIELVLHLFRNLLSAESLLQSDVEQACRDQQLHNEFIALLEQELVLEILLVLSADLETRENAPYNLLVLELMHHLLRGQDPTAVARSRVERVSIQQVLAREPRKPAAALVATRHGHFGGTLAIQTATGRQQYVSAARVGEARLAASNVTAKRKHKRTDPFVGNRTSASSDHQQARSGPAQVKAWDVLNRYCERFFSDCYGAVMKSWKNEFRRDSVRLQQDDLVVLMRIIWFFMQWRHAKDRELGPLIFTMDVFTFNLVLTATDTYTTHKKWAPLATAIALLSEMMHWLYVMYNSKEQTEQIMALGLMDRLFYANEPLDRLPKLFAKWEPRTTSRRCLADLVELSYTTLKLLDANAKSCQEFATSVVKKKEKKKGKNKEAQDTITKMKVAAADFDVNSYFARRLVSNHTVFMYTKLLSQYASNSAQTNHRILAFLLRLSKYQIHVADPESQHHPLAARTVTFEPILYSVQTLVVMDRILNDHSIRKDKKFEPLLSYCASFVHRFAKATQANPLYFVEALFRHPIPHRFCDLSANLYVSEELRMLVERDLLLEEQRRLEASGGGGADEYSGDDDDNDDSEEELEFEDFGVTAPLKPSAKRRRTGENRRSGRAQGIDARSENSDSETEATGVSKAERLAKKRRVFDDDSSDEDAAQEDAPTADASAHDGGSETATAAQANVLSSRNDSGVETNSNRPMAQDESDSDESELSLRRPTTTKGTTSAGDEGGSESRKTTAVTADAKATEGIVETYSSDSEASETLPSATSLQALVGVSTDDDS